MNRSILCGALLSAVVSMPPVSRAQAPSPPPLRQSETASCGPASDPLDAPARVPALTMRSSLRDYRPYKDAEVGPWRQLNDAVRDVGGWKTYARLSQEPDGMEVAKPPQRSPVSGPGQPDAPQAPAQTPASGAHAGHGH